MKIKTIKIDHWRNFRNVVISVPEDAALICVVGVNGTGKTQLLEMIAACAGEVGLSHGFSTERGNIFHEEHSFEIEFFLGEGTLKLDEKFENLGEFPNWDRTLKLTSTKDLRNPTLGGIREEATSRQMAHTVVDTLKRSNEVHFVSLDANRAYPQKTLQDHEMGQLHQTKWSSPEHLKGRSYMPTTTLYDEWTKYMIAQESAAALRDYQDGRSANERGVPRPSICRCV